MCPSEDVKPVFTLPVTGSHRLCLQARPSAGSLEVDLWTCQAGSALDAGSCGVSPTGRLGGASERSWGTNEEEKEGGSLALLQHLRGWLQFLLPAAVLAASSPNSDSMHIYLVGGGGQGLD